MPTRVASAQHRAFYPNEEGARFYALRRAALATDICTQLDDEKGTGSPPSVHMHTRNGLKNLRSLSAFTAQALPDTRSSAERALHAQEQTEKLQGKEVSVSTLEAESLTTNEALCV
jgi:hypothetical protein